MTHLDREIVQGFLHMGLKSGPEVQLPYKQSLHGLLNLRSAISDRACQTLYIVTNSHAQAVCINTKALGTKNAEWSLETEDSENMSSRVKALSLM